MKRKISTKVVVEMKNNGIKISILLLAALAVVIGTASATPSVQLIDGECDLDIWTYGNHDIITSGYEDYFETSIDGSIWTDDDGRLAIISEGGSMTISTEYPTECFCIVFASDKNDGYAMVYVDDVMVWEGDTWASTDTENPIEDQKIRSLKITDLDSNTHTIEIVNPDITNSAQVQSTECVHNGHVTIYKYGYNCPTEEIPEFPTVALPVAAVLGLAFLFQRRE
ncbi:MAG: hypothetical protein AWU59_547 [Methanolobus sp. T82-4]|jgi:hypothetical protein|nr:MAG: hypothetical protein AWU59_547 [Methanolobus sp. T82-4]